MARALGLSVAMLLAVAPAQATQTTSPPIVPPPSLPAACNGAEQRLIGAWVILDDGFFEEMAFSREADEPVFNSWLHHRPETYNWRWTVDNCSLTIADPSAEAGSDEPGLGPFHYSIVRVTPTRLVLRDVGDGTKSSYRRIPEAR